jgi:hypothetical protein
MRRWFFLVCAPLAVAAAAAATACDDSSSSSSSGGFTYDGGNPNYKAPDTGVPAQPGPDGGDPDSGGGTSPGPCSITLSGGVTKTLTCTVNAVWSATDNQSGISVANGSEVSMAFTATGELEAGTYGWAESLDQGGIVFENGTDAWSVNKADALGASEFVITSVSTSVVADAGKGYAVHGTVNATLVAPNDASAPVTLSATF